MGARVSVGGTWSQAPGPCGVAAWIGTALVGTMLVGTAEPVCVRIRHAGMPQEGPRCSGQLLVSTCRSEATTAVGHRPRAGTANPSAGRSPGPPGSAGGPMGRGAGERDGGPQLQGAPD